MRTGLVCAVLVAAVLLGWLLLETGTDTLRRIGDRTVGAAPAPAPVAAEPPATAREDAAPEPVRRPVDHLQGPTGARVLCVWDRDGSPAVGIPVRAYGIENRALLGPVASVASDTEGVATFSGLEVGEHAFRVHSHQVRATVEPGAVVAATLTLPLGGEVSGVVVDAGQAPVSDAGVSAEVAWIPQQVATTGADGRFRVRLLRGTIWAHKEGYRPSHLQSVKGDVDDLVLTLEAAGASLDGVVVDPDNRPVPRASVAIAIDFSTDRDRPRRPHVRLETDARGEFATTQVPRGPLIVYAYAGGFAFGQQDVDTTGPDGHRVVVRLLRTASIHGIVLGGNDLDEPLAGLPISVHRQRDLPGLLNGTSDQLTRFETVTGSDGRYRLPGLPPGRMWILAGVPPSPLYHNVRLREGEDHEWSPDLSAPSGAVRGELRGPDGAPLAGWQVTAVRVDLVQMKQELERAATDGDGRFEVKGLRPFPHTLTVTHPDRDEPLAKRTEVQPDGPPFVWRMPGLPSQCGAIAGRVLGPDGEPVTGAKLRATSAGISRNASSDPEAEAEGRFLIERVLPGSWRVVGQWKGYGSFDLGEHRVGANATVDAGTHRLQPRGSAVVRVIGRGFEPAGVALALVQVAGGDNKTTEFAADAGGLRSSELPPGRYRLLARGTNFAPIARAVTIPAGSDAAVELEARAAVPVAIEFVPEDLAEREWQDYLRFEIRDAAGGVVLSHRQEVRGAPTASFTVGLAGGAYSIEGSSPNVAYRKGSATFVVPADASGMEVRLVLEIQGR